MVMKLFLTTKTKPKTIMTYKVQPEIRDSGCFCAYASGRHVFR